MKIIEEDRSQAKIVLAIVQNKLDNTDSSKWTIKEYDNGREHGYVLELESVDGIPICYDKAWWIAWAENRRSDHTVMYSDRGRWTGRLTDLSYDIRTLFPYGDFELAADNIVTFMQCTEKEIRDVRNVKELESTNV